MTTILISAGDTSGEVHAARLVRALKDRLPRTRFVGLGGDAMEAAGVELWVHQKELAVSGVVEVGIHLPRVFSIWRLMSKKLEEAQPNLVILVDSGGFNLPLAARIKRSTDAPILYYIAPQVWAWRSGRLSRLARRVDRIVVLFPFEQDFHRERGVESEFVGHPLLDDPAALPPDETVRRMARDRLDLASDARVLALFPGSRKNEVTRNLPLQLNAWKRLCASKGPTIRAVVGVASSIDRDWIEALAKTVLGEGPTSLRFTTDPSDLMAAADTALTKPGTTTLELALRGVPMVVMARVHPVTGAIVRCALKVPWVGLPNLLAGEAIVPEYLQGDATPERLASAIARLMPSQADLPSDAEEPAKFGGPTGESSQAEDVKSEREVQVDALMRVRVKLGGPGATDRLASIVEEMLETGRA